MALVQAIKKLPTLDKRWSLHRGIVSFNYGKPGQWDIDADNCTDPMSLVAAAKTIGFMIGFVPHYSKNKYLVSPCIADMKSEKFWFLEKDEKDEPAAIIAAFKAVMEQKKG